MWNGYEVGMVMVLLCYEVGGRTGRESGVGLMGSEVMCRMEFFFFLFLENYGVRKLEAVFAILIGTMAISFAWMFGETKPSGKELLIGVLVPKLSSKTIKQAVGVVGCVIMPHNVFLHSALVQSRKIDIEKKGRVQEALNYYSIEATVALIISFMINLFVTTVFAKSFYGTDNAEHIGLVNAGQYLEEKYGGGLLPILYIWVPFGTYAGQFIMGGFLNLRLKKWLRALITRSCAIIPTVIVSLIFNRSENGGMDCGWSVMVINGYLLLDFIRVEVIWNVVWFVGVCCYSSICVIHYLSGFKSSWIVENSFEEIGFALTIGLL
ncbi:hypothetical protein MKW92_037387 [Papaver armeniacum]|nr:hypothetical protein MKW92_037387 [Papaver armeniacum]